MSRKFFSVPAALFHAAVLGGAAAALCGCERTLDDDVGGELFRPEIETRSTDRVFMAQSVSGAGEDAMLYEHHFDGLELNSLGKTKLRLMLEDAQFIADPNVYIVSGDTEHMSAVRRYLADWGLAFEDTRLHAGFNPRSRRSAALGLQDRGKFEDAEAPAAAEGTGTGTTSE